jgi:Ca-activated chloride channel family protein
MTNRNGDEFSSELSDERLTAYALGQMQGDEVTAMKSALGAAGGASVRQEVQEIQAVAAALSAARNAEPLPPASDALREKVEQRLNDNARHDEKAANVSVGERRQPRRLTLIEISVIAVACCALIALLLPAVQSSRETARRMASGNQITQAAEALQNYHDVFEGHPAGARPRDSLTWKAAEDQAPSVTSYSQVQVTDEVASQSYQRLMSRNDKLAEGDVRAKRFDSLGRLITTTVVPQTWHEVAPGTEQYDRIFENSFLSPLSQPLSTFSIDVDTASYSNVRRFLNGGRLPPADAVRIEELVNYFRYDYPQPPGNDPFSITTDVTQCPWREGHLLLRVGLKGRDVQRGQRPQSNLVFLLDVSGSMADANKLPLLKTAMKMLVEELGENDRVSIVTYAGDAGLRLPPTRGHEQRKIKRVIDSLSAGGSTNGSAGIELAYEQAAAYFVTGGTNRVILCTDGDLNVGITDDEALVKLIKRKAASGTFLTVLGFGEGNLKDAKMEKLADNGNGMYAYIDSVREARKVLVEQLTGSTIAIAKDVKIQIEFNPREIAAYRLLGYENRVLAAQDFNNDRKDAGEIGAGHTVTALYELVPTGGTSQAVSPRPGTDPLRYQQPGANLLPENQHSRLSAGRPGPGLDPANENALTDAAQSGELLTLKLRYKEPDGQMSKLLEYPLKDRGGQFNTASRDLQFAAAVASFGMILRGSEHRGTANLAAVAEIASATLGNDPGGYRAEFVDLVRKAQALGK